MASSANKAKARRILRRAFLTCLYGKARKLAARFPRHGGTSGTTLDPQGSATRAQAAAMLQRFCENIAAR